MIFSLRLDARTARRLTAGTMLAIGSAAVGACATGRADFGVPRRQPGSDIMIKESNERVLLRALANRCTWTSDSTRRGADDGCALAPAELAGRRGVPTGGQAEEIP